MRLGLYRRLAALESPQRASRRFAAELIDRFGTLPAEVEKLLQIIADQALCRKAGVAQGRGGAEGRLSPSTTTVSRVPSAWSATSPSTPRPCASRSDHRLVVSGETKTPSNA